MKERVEYLDSIKGLAIILVVMAHTIAWNYPNWEEVCLFKQSQPANYMAGGFVWQLIYTFHMALFFMVSGFLTGKITINSSNILSRLKSKTIRLLIPYLVTGYMINFVRGTWGYWFLLTLYEISLLAYGIIWFLQNFNSKKSLWIDASIFIVIYILLRGGSYMPIISYIIDPGVVKYFIPFSIGMLMRRHEIIEKIVCRSSCFSLSLFLFILLFSTRYITSYPLLYTIVAKIDFFFSILSVLACVMIFHIFIRWKESERIMSFLAYIGTLTMPIYILHNLFVIQISEIGTFILEQNVVTAITLQLVYSSVFTVISIGLSIFLYCVLSYSTFTRKLMFGES